MFLFPPHGWLRLAMADGGEDLPSNPSMSSEMGNLFLCLRCPCSSSVLGEEFMAFRRWTRGAALIRQIVFVPSLSHPFV